MIGLSLGHALVARGDQLVILTRGRARDFSHACKECGPGGKVEFVTWTPEASGSWMEVVDGADTVVNLAGAGIVDERWTPERKALLRSSRIVSTKLLSEAIAKAKRKPSVLVSASAIGRYGLRTGSRIVTEEDPAGDDFLAVLTRDWEAAAAPARDAGVRVCHPRIGLVLGREGGVYAKLAPLFRAYVGGPVGSGEQYVAWVHLRDASRAFECLIERKDLEGAFNVAAPEPVTMNTFASALGETLHRPAVMRVPPFAVKLAMGSEAASSVLSGQRAIPKRLVDAGFAFVFPDVRSALEDLAATGAEAAAQ